MPRKRYNTNSYDHELLVVKNIDSKDHSSRLVVKKKKRGQVQNHPRANSMLVGFSSSYLVPLLISIEN